MISYSYGKRNFPNGTLIRVSGWGRSYLCVVVNSWMINSHERMYRLVHQNGKIFESYEGEFRVHLAEKEWDESQELVRMCEEKC